MGMHCKSCGFLIGNSFKFCANCGQRVEETTSLADVYKQAPLTEPPPNYRSMQLFEAFGTASGNQRTEEFFALTDSYRQAPLTEPPLWYREMPLCEESDNHKPERLFFGKTALSFCLAVIAVLSVTSGMFIGMYLYERERGTGFRPPSGGGSFTKLVD
jgi:hypothetical protein